MSKSINVLSLFNGMSCGMMALDNLGINVSNYYSSEIDKYANQAAQALYPDTIQLGDVTKWKEWDIDWSSIDLVTGGFPCQAWSMAGKQLGDKDERGMLFWTMLDIIKHVKDCNPNADFLIENVKMKKEFEQYITQHTENALGKVHKILINSALVSAQNRNRYYWTSFDVEQPDDKGILLKDIIELDCNDVNSDGWHKWWNEKKEFQLRKKYSTICNDGTNDKAITMTARQYASWNGNFAVAKCGNYRKLTPRECMRLQTIPEHHIDTLLNAGISNTQLYKMTGNGWTVDVISHILKGLK